MDKDALSATAQADKHAKSQADAAHRHLVDAIWEAADEGWRQVDIVAATGLTRERIRQLCDPTYREHAMQRRGRK